MTPSFNLGSLPGTLPPKLPENVDLEASQPLAQQILESGVIGTSTLLPTALWRDHLALTGQVRTYSNSQNIAQVWNKRVRLLRLTDVKTKPGRVVKPVPDSSWIEVSFTFTTNPEDRLVGKCSGVVSFTLDEAGEWKIWLLVTLLDSFDGHGHPDVHHKAKASLSNGHANGTTHGANGHTEDLDKSPNFDAIVLGAGQCGLSIAGRLGALGLQYVLLEKQPSIGNNWVGRYESVRQHTVREYNNLPFERTWKPTDPELLPGKIVAEGFENYVKKYDINMWTSADTTHATWSPEDRTWTLDVTVTVNGVEEQRKLICRHLVISIGAGMSVDKDPGIPGAEQYHGILMSSGAYKHSRDWAAKDGIVIGSGTMAHDIAEDMYRAGLRSVHMIQRQKTCIYPIEWVMKGQSAVYNLSIPTATSDALSAGRPTKISRDIIKILYDTLTVAESSRFDALERQGFRVDRTTPLLDNIYGRYGGYYIDIGASAHIARGEIKVKSGVPVATYTESGLKFEDGSEIKGDVVVTAVGQDHDYRNQVANITGREFASRLGEFWGLDEEGEVRGVMKPAAPGLWMFGGTAPQARWYSRFIALGVQSDVLGKPIECVQIVG